MSVISNTFGNQVASQGSSSRVAALFIDVQSFDGMERQDAVEFKKTLSQHLEELRARHIAVIWVAIAKGGAKLLDPSDNKEDSQARYGLDVLEDMGFTGHRTEHDHHDLYAELIAQHGPRKGEAVYRKPSMSALAEVTDILQRDDILEESGIKFRSRKTDKDHPDFRYIEPHEADKEFQNLFAGQKTLAAYLREQDINRTIIFGAVSYYCVTKTAEDAYKKGFAPTVASDMVLSWQYPVENAEERQKATLIWQAGQGVKAPFHHAALILEKAQYPLALMPIRDAIDRNQPDGLVAPVVA